MAATAAIDGDAGAPKTSGDRCGMGAPAPKPEDILTLACVTALCGWREIGALACSSRTLHTRLFGGKDEEGWRSVCQALALEAGLYAPLDWAGGYRRLFFEHLWPARGKWEQAPANGEEGSAPPRSHSFHIEVAARFRPGDSGGGRILLPLHQRIKLLKKGEKLSFGAGDASLPPEAVERLVSCGAELTPDLIQALLDAESLRHVAGRAEADARGPVNSRPKGIWDDEIEGGEGGREEEEEEEEGRGRAVGGARRGGAGEGAGRARREGPGGEEEDDEGPAPPRPGGAARVLAVQPTRAVLYVPGAGVRPFHFSRVFSKESAQEEVYDATARGAAISALNGFNSCLLCYGQTGSGKTFTTFGPDGAVAAAAGAKGRAHLLPQSGMALRALGEVLDAVAGTSDPEAGGGWVAGGRRGPARVTIQCVEVYMEEVTCLLTGAPVRIRDAGAAAGADQFVLQGASEEPVQGLADVADLLMRAEARKRFASTAMNSRSSRAHTVLVAALEQADEATGTLVRSHLQFVDLAGCEQLKQSKASGQRRSEAVAINSSLMVLGRVITALVEEKMHVPYYESKLTQLLKGAFGGNSRTVAIVTASPEPAHADQTLSALRFGELCAHVTNDTQHAVGSVEDALAAIDSALAACEAGMTSLAARGKGHLPSALRMRERYQQLRTRRTALHGLSGASIATPSASHKEGEGGAAAPPGPSTAAAGA